MIRYIAILAALALPAAAGAQKISPKKPAAKPTVAKSKPAPSKPRSTPTHADGISDRAEQGGFGVLQVAAPDARQFVGAWGLGTASKITTTTTVADKPLFTFIIFSGCKAGADGKCDVVADFAIHRPDGSVDDDHKNMAIWQRPPSDSPNKLVLGDGALGFGTDSDGPFGEYRIAAAVTDKVAGITLHTEQVLTVTPVGQAPAVAVPETTTPMPAPDNAAPMPESTPSATPPEKPRGR